MNGSRAAAMASIAAGANIAKIERISSKNSLQTTPRISLIKRKTDLRSQTSISSIL